MKKVLILTTSTGQGHNQAAKSLSELLKKNDFKCVSYDFLSNSSRFLIEAIVGGYEISAMNFPNIYGFVYKLTNNKYINALTRIPFFLVKKRLLSLINIEKPDIIISTHPLSICIMDKLKEDGLNIPFVSVVTDFKAHYSYIGKNVDAYITGSEFTKNSLIDKKIEKEKIYPLGIPIRESFFENDENIPNIKSNDFFNILLMSGSMGLKNISYVLTELLKNKHKLRITVVCGNNKKLKEDLIKNCSKAYPDKKLHILGFSNDIASFMEYSDVLISKPGGLTVTESIVKDLPLVIPFAIPGQEQENTEFLTSEGYAIEVKKIEDINKIIDSLIDNPNNLTKMKSKISKLSNTYSLNSIVKLANDLIKRTNIKE